MVRSIQDSRHTTLRVMRNRRSRRKDRYHSTTRSPMRTRRRLHMLGSTILLRTRIPMRKLQVDQWVTHTVATLRETTPMPNSLHSNPHTAALPSRCSTRTSSRSTIVLNRLSISTATSRVLRRHSINTLTRRRRHRRMFHTQPRITTRNRRDTTPRMRQHDRELKYLPHYLA